MPDAHNDIPDYEPGPAPTFTDQDRHWMARALNLAKQGQGKVEPNPMVGCVLVSPDNQVLGEGFHEAFGGPHAEINAINHAHHRGMHVRGATCYVTLEPCAHQGKTPPCSLRLVDEKVGRVVAAMRDPFPAVAGRGFQQLKDAGIDVAVGLMEAEAQRLNAPFVKHTQTGLPFVICKWAQTLDGKIATATGHSQWISNAESRLAVHRLRARVDAVIVGIGTALADDPALTARDVPVHRHARRVLIDPNLRATPDLKLFTQPGPPITLATLPEHDDPKHPVIRELRRLGGECFHLSPQAMSPTCDAGDNEPAKVASPNGVLAQTMQWLSLKALLQHLAQAHQATNVLVEGGAVVHGALFEEGLVDQIDAYIAPKLLGDPAAPSAAAWLAPPQKMDQAMGLTLLERTAFGQDTRLRFGRGGG